MRENWVKGIIESLYYLCNSSANPNIFHNKTTKEKKTSGKLLNLQQHNSTPHVRVRLDIFPIMFAFIPPQ